MIIFKSWVGALAFNYATIKNTKPCKMITLAFNYEQNNDNIQKLKLLYMLWSHDFRIQASFRRYSVQVFLISCKEEHKMIRKYGHNQILISSIWKIKGRSLSRLKLGFHILLIHIVLTICPFAPISFPLIHLHSGGLSKLRSRWVPIQCNNITDKYLSWKNYLSIWWLA